MFEKLEKKSMHLDDLMPLIREQLQSGASVRIHPRGTSMLPMIREGVDSVVLSKLPEKPEKYDVILYQRENGQYVLHRLVKAGETYTFIGDNQFNKEKGIKHEQLIARVSSFYRGKKKISVDKLSYRLYCRMWYNSRGIRRIWRMLSSFVQRGKQNQGDV